MSNFKEYHLVRTGQRVLFLKKVEGEQNPISFEQIDPYCPPLVFRIRVNGKSVVYRYIAECDEIEQAVQIKNGYPANRPFEQRDRDDVRFINGILRTDKANVQLFFDSIPANESFTQDRGDYQVLFREYISQVATVKSVALARAQSRAFATADTLAEEDLDIKLLLIYGSTFVIPETRDDKLESILEAINEAEDINSRTLAIIANKNTTDTVETIVGKALNLGLLSFIQKPSEIMIKRGGKFEDFYRVSAEHSEEQKQSLFHDKLDSADGAAMLSTIKEAIANYGKVVVEVPQVQPQATVETDDDIIAKYNALMAKKAPVVEVLAELKQGELIKNKATEKLLSKT